MNLHSQHSAALDELSKRLAASDIVPDEELFFEGIDHMRYFFKPDAAIRPRSADGVGEVLKLANKYKIGVSVRGRGTGCAGGALPYKGGWVLDLSALSQIKIDPVSWTAEVGAGAITANIDAEARKFGLFYPPDPSSHLYCSIGGNIACNAGGLRAAKYGVTRDYVLALEGYLPSGEFVRWGRPLRKFSTGFNIRDLWIGSEGALGVVTKAWLKLLRAPEGKKTYLFTLPDSVCAFKCTEEILQAGAMPSILEFVDSQSCLCARKYCGDFATFPDGAAVLLAELDGSIEQISAAEKPLLKAAEKYALKIRAAEKLEDSEKLWTLRRKCSQSMYEISDSKISQDIVLPISKAAEFFAFFYALGREKGVATPTFGHAADGNYHIHAMYSSQNSDSAKNARIVMDSAIEKCVGLGGAVSGEHGVGILKTKYMPLQHSETEIAAMRAVKHALDPNNILNAGKVLEYFDSSKYTPLKGVRLPWDK